jgi:hypothetical protein
VAVLRPIPEDAPVMRTVLPSRRFEITEELILVLNLLMLTLSPRPGS